MSTAAVFLLVALGAAIVGSLALYFGHRVRQSPALDFHEQLRALAPRDPNRSQEQSSGIVHLESGPDEER